MVPLALARLRRAPVQHLYDDDKSTAPGGQSSRRSATPRWRQSETQEAMAVEINSDELLQFRPLRNSPFGRFCYGLCCAVSAQFLALYVIFLVDFYNRCQVGSIDNLCFSGDHFLFGGYMQNGQTFFVVWCCRSSGSRAGSSTRGASSTGSACRARCPRRRTCTSAPRPRSRSCRATRRPWWPCSGG